MGGPSCHLCNKKLSFDFFLQNEGAQIHSIFPENRLTRKLETILQHSAEVALPWGNMQDKAEGLHERVQLSVSLAIMMEIFY